MIRSVIFDIDGTLIDHQTSQARALRRLYRHLEIKGARFNEFHDLWKRVGKKYFDEYADGKISLSEQRILRIQEVLGGFGREIGNNGALGLFEIYLSFYKDHWLLYPEVKGVLKELKDDFVLGVISNGDSRGQREKLEMTGISGLFDAIVISEDIGSAKPGHMIFDHALSMLGVSPGEALFVGDDMKADIGGAKRAGILDVFVDREGLGCKEATYVIGDLHGLMEIVKR